jgi:hypothetical protein
MHRSPLRLALVSISRADSQSGRQTIHHDNLLMLNHSSFAPTPDFGNISYHLPSVHPMYKIPIDDPKTQGNHTVGFTAASRTPAAHEATLKATEGIAVLGARVLVEEEYRGTLWREWKEWKKGTEKGEVK